MRNIFRSTVVLSILIAWLLVPARTAASDIRQMTMQAELFDDLMQWAVKLSGLPSATHMPTIYPMGSEQLVQKVCPEDPRNCRSLVSFYSTKEEAIFYIDSLDLGDDTDLSFIVHELVHHLQYSAQGDSLFSTCQKVMTTETQAYAVQNKYLAHFKQWRRVGDAIRFIHCDALEDSVSDADPSISL
jgi:hypothetical protein